MLNVIVAFLLASSVTDGTSRPPEPPPAEVAAMYEQLLSKPTSERRKLFRDLPSVMQARVWARHLSASLERHPEFTAEQRALIAEATALLTPERFEIQSTDPRWETLIDQPLRRLQQRAIALFGPRLARELFADLGPEVPKPGVNRTEPSPRGHAGAPAPQGLGEPAPENAPECECSVASDWCSNWGNFACKNAWCLLSKSGCGTFFRYECEGMCRVT